LKEGYKKTHQLGAYKKILRKAMRKEKEKKRLKKKKLKLPSLKGKSKIKENAYQV